MTAKTPGAPFGARSGHGPHGTDTPPTVGVPRQRGQLRPDDEPTPGSDNDGPEEGYTPPDELPERPEPPDTHR